MAKHTNIVDFDEARAASRVRRAQGAGARDGRRQPQQAARRRGELAVERQEDEEYQQRQNRSRAAASGRAGRTQNAVKKQTSDRDAKKRSRNKARADKMFEKQFAGEAAASNAEAEGAPRAALYKGQMGAGQRRAARMQKVSEATPVSAKINPAGWFSNLNISARSIRIATAVICVVLVGVFLYVPARQYYQSVREHDRLEAQYAVIEERNAALDEQNDALAGDAGMEDAVREKYGYVRKGDQTAVVSGLSDRTLDTSRDGDEIEANVLTSAVKAPEEWYTPYLDAFFGVS